MTGNLYDLEASEARLANLKQSIEAQRAYITTLPPEQKDRAVKNLETLEDMLELSQKTHRMIISVLLARQAIEAC